MSIFEEVILKSLSSILPLVVVFFVCLFFVFCLFAFSRAASAAHGDSQARGPIGAVATSLRHSHSNVGPKPCLQQLTAMPDP